MAVNLLPQTPPQNHPEARAASKPDDAAGGDAPSFSESLIAAANALPEKPAGTSIASRGEFREPAEAKTPRTPAEDELATLLIASAQALSVDAPPAMTPALPVTPERVNNPVAAAHDKHADLSATDPKTLITASLNPVMQHGPDSLEGVVPVTTTPPNAPNALSAPGAPDIAPLRSERKTAQRAPPETVVNEAAARERPDPTAKPATAVIGAEFSAMALLIPHEQKALHTIDTASTLPASDVRAVASVPATPPVQVTTSAPAFTPAWRDEVTQHLTQFVMMRQDRAEIRLHPADLGPISVQIQMDGGQANLLIQAPQAATRDGLELALPQLRDSLAQQGITLGETNIRDQRQPDQQSSERALPYASGKPVTAGNVVPDAPRVRLGLVDLFA